MIWANSSGGLFPPLPVYIENWRNFSLPLIGKNRRGDKGERKLVDVDQGEGE